MGLGVQGKEFSLVVMSAWLFFSLAPVGFKTRTMGWEEGVGGWMGGGRMDGGKGLEGQEFRSKTSLRSTSFRSEYTYWILLTDGLHVLRMTAMIFFFFFGGGLFFDCVRTNIQTS